MRLCSGSLVSGQPSGRPLKLPPSPVKVTKVGMLIAPTYHCNTGLNRTWKQSTVSCGVVSSGPRQFDNDGNCSESGSQRKNSSSKLDQNPTLKEKRCSE